MRELGHFCHAKFPHELWLWILKLIHVSLLAFNTPSSITLGKENVCILTSIHFCTDFYFRLLLLAVVSYMQSYHISLCSQKIAQWYSYCNPVFSHFYCRYKGPYPGRVLLFWRELVFYQQYCLLHHFTPTAYWHDVAFQRSNSLAWIWCRFSFKM